MKCANFRLIVRLDLNLCSLHMLVYKLNNCEFFTQKYSISNDIENSEIKYSNIN